jgi:hypothetical protein
MTDKNFNNSNNNYNNWSSLPEVAIRVLSLYFKQSDIIELSKVCVYYRNLLRPCALKSIIIPYIDENKPIINIGPFNSLNKSEAIINCLAEDFKGSCYLVKEVALKSDYSNQFVNNLLTLFQKVSVIECYRSRGFNLNGFVEALSNSKSLQHITYKSRYAKYNPLEENIDYNFFHQLKSIRLSVLSLVDRISPFDAIDSSYSNLRCLTVTSNHMLDKLSNGLPSLRSVKFEGCTFAKDPLLKFICNNPELKKISISSDDLDEDIATSILVLEKLVLLEIHDNILTDIFNFNIRTKNYSIRHFKYNGCGINQNILNIVKSCNNIKYFELYDILLIQTLQKIIEEKYPLIDTLLINRPFKVSDILQLIANLTKFNRVKFRNCCRFEDLYEVCKNLESFGWMPKQHYSRDTDEFTLIRKLDN